MGGDFASDLSFAKDKCCSFFVDFSFAPSREECQLSLAAPISREENCVFSRQGKSESVYVGLTNRLREPET